MTEDELKALLNGESAQLNPEKRASDNIDANVKRKSINLALAEFDAVQKQKAAPKNKPKLFQGIWLWLRPMFESQSNSKDKPMKKQMWIYSGVGTACVVMLGVLFVKNQPSDFRMPNDLVGETVVSDYNEVTKQDTSIPQVIDADPVKPLADKFVDQQIAPPAPGLDSVEGLAVKELVPEGNSVQEPVATKRKESKAVRPMSKGAVAGATLSRTSKMHSPALSSYARAPAIAQDIVPSPPEQEFRDDFETFDTNPIKLVKENPVSTFSVDVDTASYSFVRRQLNRGLLPQKDAVRIEEMVNYFDYSYPLPANKEQPFKPSIVVSDSPWAEGKKLMHVGIKGYDVTAKFKPKTNLVFLLDVSGSMNSPDKLPLVKQSMNLLLSQLNPTDTVAMVVYAGAAGTVLEPTPVKDSGKIVDALNKLSAGGSTAGAQGIQLAYELAERNFDKNAINRIILATDGDFNVGINDREQLKGFVERKREKGIYLSVLGFGQGNYHDHLMQTLAQNGNGVAAYIDSLSEAQKVLVTEATSTLFPIAKDVKIQVEFNPNTVKEYRLIGYETRALKREDFNNDKVDAGDIGSGHTVTAIYEITPVGSNAVVIDDLRYGKNAQSNFSDKTTKPSGEYAFVKIRYKLPSEKVSKLIEEAVPQGNTVLNKDNDSKILQREINFSTAVAAFAQQLKDEKYLSVWNYQQTLNLAQENKGEDEYGYRTEFVQLVRKAMIAK